MAVSADRLQLVVIILTGLILSCICHEDECEEGWAEFEDQCYKLVRDAVRARRKCGYYDSHLAYINTREEADFLCHLATQQNLTTFLDKDTRAQNEFAENITDCRLEPYGYRQRNRKTAIICEKAKERQPKRLTMTIVSVLVSVPVSLLAIVIAIILSIVVCRLSKSLHAQRSERTVDPLSVAMQDNDPDVELYAQINDAEVRKGSCRVKKVKTAPMPLPEEAVVEETQRANSLDAVVTAPNGTTETANRGHDPYSYVHVDQGTGDPNNKDDIKAYDVPKMDSKPALRIDISKKTPLYSRKQCTHSESLSPLISPRSEYSLEMDIPACEPDTPNSTQEQPPVYSDLSLYDKSLLAKTCTTDNKVSEVKTKRFSLSDAFLASRPQIVIPVDRQSHFLTSPTMTPPGDVISRVTSLSLAENV